MKIFTWFRKNMHGFSLLILSIGVLINAFIIPTYQGVGLWGSEKDQAIYNFRKSAGDFANFLIIIGTCGQMFCLFKKGKSSVEDNESKNRSL